jgi:hypothetical protein
MTDSDKVKLFDFKVISKFKDIYFSKLLQKQHLVEKELFIQDMKTPDDPEGFPEKTYNDFFYELRREGKTYLLQTKHIRELPIMVTESERVGYKGNGYRLIKKFKSARFKPEKHHTFKELVDEIAPFSHTHSQDFTLYKLLVIASLFDRINFRCSSEPAFGKDSFMSIMEDFTGEIGVIQNPTIAKLEFMTLNKVLMVNEVVNLEAKEIRDVEQYLLSTGDFDNKYTKRSRGSKKHGSQEEYDISKLSLVIAYNNKDCYRDGTKYFDHMFQKAVLDRFPAFKFNGKLDEKFKDVYNAKKVAEDNKDFFVNLIRSLNWWNKYWKGEMHHYARMEFPLTLRHARVFDVLSNFIDLYAETEEEYKLLMNEMYKRTLNYKTMLQPQKTWDESMVTTTHIK